MKRFEAEGQDMKHIITVQHTQSVHHTNGMVGSWTDWDLTELGRFQESDNLGIDFYQLYLMQYPFLLS